MMDTVAVVIMLARSETGKDVTLGVSAAHANLQLTGTDEWLSCMNRQAVI